jgi:endonuclease YncB( thermonuclease family)
MVHTGWAVADPAIGQKFAKTQARARKARRGLWRGEFSLSGRDK